MSAFSYDTKVLLERHVDGRDLAISILEGDGGPEALPIVEAVPNEGAGYDFEARYEIGRTTFVCPAELDDEHAARAQQLALDAYRVLGCYGFARVDLMLEYETGELYILEANAIPGPDRDEPAPPGRRGGRDRLRRAHRARARPRLRADGRGLGPRGATPRRPRSPRA